MGVFRGGNAVFGGMAGILGHVKKCVKRNVWGVSGGKRGSFES